MALIERLFLHRHDLSRHHTALRIPLLRHRYRAANGHSSGLSLALHSCIASGDRRREWDMCYLYCAVSVVTRKGEGYLLAVLLSFAAQLYGCTSV
jgi:hypothetical protein